MFNEVLYIESKHITVIYTKLYEVVAKMVLQHYDTEAFDGTLFVINVLVDEDSNNFDFRKQFNAKHYIYYQLDHLTYRPEFMSPEYSDQFDEIWDFGIEHLWVYPKEMLDKVHFMPLRYVELPKIAPKDEYKYDLVFIGTLTQRRFELINFLTRYWTKEGCKVKVISGIPYSELYDELSDCKYVFNMPRNYDGGWIQNQVRIVEALCSGKAVISYTLGGAAEIYSYLIKNAWHELEILDLVKSEPVDMSEEFKKWTDTDEDYENYRKEIMLDRYMPRLI